MANGTAKGLLFSSALLLVALPALAGCGAANRIYSIVWTATLDKMPNAICARDAIASVPDISGTEMRPRPGGYFFGVHLANGNISGPDIYIAMIREGREPVQFRMNYGDYQSASAARESAARAILSRLSAGCGIPELEQRATETRNSEWRPYLFNI